MANIQKQAYSRMTSGVNRSSIITINSVKRPWECLQCYQNFGGRNLILPSSGKKNKATEEKDHVHPMPCGYLHIYKPFFRVAEKIPQGNQFLYARYQVTRYGAVTSKMTVIYTLILYSVRQSGLQFTHPQSRSTHITVFPAILLLNGSVVCVCTDSQIRDGSVGYTNLQPPSSFLKYLSFPFLFVTNSCPLTTEGSSQIIK